MTTDTAEYTITFPNPKWDGANEYTSAAYEAASEHVDVEVNIVDAATLEITVTADNNVIPVYEQELREHLPDGVEIECDVVIGS